MKVVHRSKIDLWLQAVILAAMALAGVSCITAILAGGLQAWWAIILPGVVGIGLPLWILLTTRYTLDGDTLFVQSGPFRWRIPFAEITAVTPTRNPLASPALSLDRLRIDYGNGRSLMVSPADKERFVADLDRAQNSVQAI